jgi:hypothetical protein
MGLAQVDRITLDYCEAAARDERLLISLSAVAVAGRYLWTASDEGRTLECLEPDGDAYRLRAQYKLDDLFRKLPNEDDGGDSRPDEADIESLAVCGGALWICGSHCTVRKESKKARDEKKKAEPRIRLDPEFKLRPSRHLLGCVPLKEDGGGLEPNGDSLPYQRGGSLRRVLHRHPFLRPFVALPSKENGLDIEGLAVQDKNRLFLGLRGPVVDSYAVVIEVELDKRFRLKDRDMVTHFLKLDGLGVRDLAEFGDEILILAGPVSEASAPFRLYRWRPAGPKDAQYVQSPNQHPDWPVAVADPTTRGGNPEGICRLDRDRSGLIVLYDSPDKAMRIAGTSYRADWIPFA